MENFTVNHDFRNTDLEYIPGSTTYTVNGGGGGPGGNPTLTASGRILTWDAGDIPALALVPRSPNHNYDTVEITFQVRSRSGTEENLVNVTRDVEAGAAYTFCPGTVWESNELNTDRIVLPLWEPQPSVIKRGRNVDAGQNNYTATVYGNTNDDVIWRIRIRNSGRADLEDLTFDDLMSGSNFQINFACPSQGEANAIATADGVGPVGNCITASNNINNFPVDDPFGNPANDENATFVDVPAGGFTDVFLVGKILNSCDPNSNNTVRNVEWGCEVDNPDGGISQTSTGTTAGTSTTTLSSRVNNGGLNISRSISGTNPGQPAGSKGVVTITITNNTGGTVKNIHLRDLLPPEYIMDPTYDPANGATINVTPAYGNVYPGMVDRIVWANPAANTLPLTSTNPAEPLANTQPEFDLISSSVHPDHSDQRNLLRHGDVAEIRFGVVMIPQPGYDPYDLRANLDLREEVTADLTDPNNAAAITNRLWVTFEQFCNPGITQQASSFPYIDVFNSNPEDLDIDISGTELIFILTNDTSTPLPLQVALRNRGGHTADDFTAYVTFGATMDVVSAPGACSVTTNPLEVWDDPADLPANATIYECRSSGVGSIAPGQTRNLNFEVIKSSDSADLAADDLSFRADVIGEITLADGSLLWFPTPQNPIARIDPIVNRANNYSFDGIRARVIGFNLEKDLLGTCSENNPPAILPDRLNQIGEECTYNIHTGGWFGFQTPGFTYIAVQAITVTDELPNGQAYISSSDPYLTSDPAILSIALAPVATPPLLPLDEGWFTWSFNQDTVNERITVRDQWFDVNVTTRLLNDPVDDRSAPNQHAALSTNVLNSTFQAVFYNDVLGAEEVFNLGENTIGYPRESLRRVDLTVTEPLIAMVKEVCNETLYGVGTSCSNFVTLANDGDTQDSYIYRITLSNEAIASAVDRAPAYNIITTDVLDPSDMVYVLPFGNDGLDNDGDGLIDAADTDGEGSISDNTVQNGLAPTIIASHTHSVALQRLNPGASIVMYYRIDPDDSVAPAQQLVNNVSAVYDSLEGNYGNQTVVLSANSTLGGARVYSSAVASATVQILPLQTYPKTVLRLSNTALNGVQPQPVSIGEEVEYELRASIPVANLQDFYIRDVLPAGLSCVEAPVVNLDAPPYSDAGFFPGGQITPSCNENQVYWYFGNQELTTAPDARSRFDFYVRFIARLDNNASNNDGGTVSNGMPATSTLLHYLNDAGTDVNLDFSQHDLLVREPNIVLSKTYETISADAGDVLTVTITAQNTGTATAYNLRVLDDLTGRHQTFLNNVSGTDPPDIVDTTLFGANQPVFRWNRTNPNHAIAPGQSISFRFEVLVDLSAQPLQILENTVQADWTSLPGQDTALNSSSLIGANGSADGMRIGALPNAANPINDYETFASAQFSVPPLSITKTDVDAADPAQIGRHKHFQLRINLPEGTTQQLSIRDQLDVTGLSYVLSHNSDYAISYTFNDIDLINGQTPQESALLAVPADGTTGNIDWNVGTVTTVMEDDTATAALVNPYILIDYFVRINNDLNTNVGDTLQNAAGITYRHGQTGAVQSVGDTTAVVTVVEPLLTLSKSVNPTTPLIGGDTPVYTLTISNVGNAVAYDVNIVDTLPPQLQLDNNFTPTAYLDAVPIPGFVATPGGSPSGPLIWGRGNADETLDIPPGGVLLLTYRAVVTIAQPNASFSNSVLVDWTSLQGDSVYERHGNGCPAIVAPNDYCVGPASAQSVAGDSNRLSKMVIADTFVDAGSSATDGIVRVGDLVTYRLELNLQPGMTRAVSIEDILPPGMAFYDVVSINGDTTVDYESPLLGLGSNFVYNPVVTTALPTMGQTGNLQFNLGDVYNNPLGDAGTDTLVIEYRTQVMPDTLAHQASVSLDNLATLNYLDAAGVAVVDPARLQSGASITVWQPIIPTLTKVDRSGRTSVANVSLGSDIMNFRVEACNTTGLAPAYSLSFSDTLAMELDETSISGPMNGAGQPDVYLNGAMAVAGVDYVYTAPVVRGGSFNILTLAPMHAGQCIQVDYDLGFHTDIASNQTWNNSVLLQEYWSLPNASGQRYAPVGPATFAMTNGMVIIDPPLKTLVQPASGEASIGEEVIYEIRVPGTAANAVLYDVVVSDVLPPYLEFVTAIEVSGSGFVLVNNSVAPGNVSLSLDTIPAGSQAVIQLRTRVANNAQTNAGQSVLNSVSYSYALSSAGPVVSGGTAGAAPLRIIEPLLSLSKTVSNVTNPGLVADAGDVLRFSLTLTASGGVAADNFADAFDITVQDNLSLGLQYIPGTSVVTGVYNATANSVSDPILNNGDGVNSAQTLSWSAPESNAQIHVSEGSTVVLSYDVKVLDNVLSSQVLLNQAVAQWSSLPGDSNYERNGSGSPPENDYFTTPASASVSVPANNIQKTRLTDTYGALDNQVRIGDVVEFELRIQLHEGTSPDVVITDTLPQGLAFAGVVSINGDTLAPYSAAAPLIHDDVVEVLPIGDPRVGATSFSLNFGTVLNPGDNILTNNEIVVSYRALVLEDVFPHLPSIALINTASLSYTDVIATASHGASDTLVLQQPLLNLSKTAAPNNGDTVLDANEVVTYTVNIANNGASPAYDTSVVDIIPQGMRVNGITTLSMQLLTSGTVLPVMQAVYDDQSGTATWNLDVGVSDAYSIPVGDTLQIIYQVQADADLAPGLTLNNQVRAQRYYSFDNDATPVLGNTTGVAQIYGPSNTAIAGLSTAAANPLDKQNTVTTAAVGVPFSYRIIVPASPMTTALHDVRILDDLSASSADMSFVSVSRISGSQTWNPVNTGTAVNVVIEDVNGGIYIPAGEQIEIELVVVLNNSAVNISGLFFNNTATYTYNRVNDDVTTQANGAPDTTADMQIVGPDNLTLQKSGPAQIRVGVAAQYRLDIHNTGTATAWDATVTDLLPNPVPGGMCDDTAPVIVNAQVFQADGITPVSPLLMENTDYRLEWVPGTPVCRFSFIAVSSAAAIPADHRLVILYDAYLDQDSLNNISLSNIAGVTQWFSGDTDNAIVGGGAMGPIRTYSRVITDGTPTVLDHEDIYTTITEAAVIVLQKTVANVSTGENPALTASPGDRLRYRISAYNQSTVALNGFSIQDELDRLNIPAAFVPGSLTIVSVPTGSDISNTNSIGGAQGSGLLDVRNLSLGAMGEVDESLIIEFEAVLAPVLESARVVLNQAQLLYPNWPIIPSDDPNVNGSDDPNVLGDEDPTPVAIVSSPWLQVQKISDDITGLATELMPGDILRYTITVRNLGTENAVNVMMRDQVPANTTYVTDSTRLNGIAVPDPATGVSPLQSGLMIHAPVSPTPGYLPVGAATDSTYMAVIHFDVRINMDAINGSIISNQAYVNAYGVGSGPLTAEQPSDDPNTALPDDPTLDVVGNLPFVDSQKTVSLVVDNGAPGFVDPGDVLRYTIITTNYGAVPATNVILRDAVPLNTTYVANTVTLNGLPVGQPDAGVSPLIAGVALSSSDLTPPVPEVGYISPGASAGVTFDVEVNAGVAPGTVISNQGFIYSLELPLEPTDADGIDSNGDQPTLIVVGNAQQLSITKQVNVVGGGVATAGGQLEYRVTVTNIGAVPAANVVISDNLDMPLVGQKTYVVGSATLNGQSSGISVTAGTIGADYWNTYGYLAPGQSATLRFLVNLNPTLSMGTRVTNIARVDWDINRFAEATVSVDIGGAPGQGALNGQLWHDSNFNDVADSGERPLEAWTVQVYFRGTLLASTLTDSGGHYRLSGLMPNYLSADRYELRFVAPGAGVNSAKLGLTSSAFNDGLQHIRDIIVASGNNLQDLNLPIDPNGVVYDSIVRTPIAGAVLTLVHAANGQAVPAACFDDPAQQDQRTLADGYYKFDLNFSQVQCPPGANYLIRVTPPSGFNAGESIAIPAQSNTVTVAFVLPTCPGTGQDAVMATGQHCEVQTFATAPPPSIAARAVGTEYHLHLTLSNSLIPGHSQIFNNHIPLDPELEQAVAITKVSSRVTVSRGDLVPYTITITNTLPVTMTQVVVEDDFPAGFKYVKGSARLDGVAVEPQVNGNRLSWDLSTVQVNAKHRIQLLFAVGGALIEGKYVNRARVISSLLADNISEEASATVRVVPDATLDCSDIIGKVFDDSNQNGIQDGSEPGLAGVRLATANGLLLTTDAYGRFHISCAMAPDERRGSNFILKLDDRTLPSGFRMTTENPRVQRITRGKLHSFNFGASLYRLVSLDVGDGVFEPNTAKVRQQWEPRFDVLQQQLLLGPALLRINYLADVESEDLVRKRIRLIKQRIYKFWQKNSTYRLKLETKLYWRHGEAIP
ncbi:MAG: hypothetical protein OEZ68_06810 [Gammaproteobacteria bacterium]|nr:hypothetical protein [Gammaproteobacteria bacterium]MDH5800500.1 hypothetical protein [Gammaproteobacteria bacterium]